MQPVIEALPPLAVAVLAGLVVVGAVLWLLGRKIAPVATGICGLVLGGVAGFVVGERLSEQGAYTLPLVIGGGIAGGLLSAMLFRVWMGVSAAVLFALAAPAAAIVWQGTPPPAVDLEVVTEEVRAGIEEAEAEAAEAEKEAAEEAERERRRSAKPQASPRGQRGQAEAPAAAEPAAAPSVVDTWLPRWVSALRNVASRVYETQSEAVRGWWDTLGPAGHWLVMIAALLGLVIGLAFGVAAPYWAAMVQTALVGAMLMLLPARELAMQVAPGLEGWLPSTPRPTLLLLGLITAVGVAVQWALFGRSADR